MPVARSSSRGGADHRLEVAEVRRGDGDLGGDDDLILGRHRLGVVALHPAARGLDVARVQVAEIDLARRRRRRLERLRRAAEASAVLHRAARPVVLVGLVGLALDPVLFFQPAPGLPEPVGPVARDRPPSSARARRGGAWPRAASAPALRGRQLAAAARRRARRRTARPPRRRRPRPRRGSRARSARSRAWPAARRWRDLGAVDGDHPDPDQAGLGAERQHLAEQLGQRASRGAGETARSSCDPAPGWRRSRAWRRPRRSAARSAATTAPRSRSRRATARPSSPDRAPPGHARRRDRPRRTRSDPTPRRRRSQTTRDAPPAATRAGSAATTAPDRDHTRGSSAPSREWS